MPKLIVIGSGSGGLTAAIGLAKVGYDTTIIEKEFIGGDCTNFGCIPSKTLLQGAKKIYTAYQTLNKTKDKEYTLHAEKVLEKTREMVAKFREHESEEWLKKNNVALVRGTAQFTKPKTIEVIGDQNYTLPFDTCVIATGSKAYIPNIKGLQDTPYLTNKTIFNLQKIPKSLTILGNGVIAVELGEAFAMLGSKVTIVGREKTILKRSDPENRERLMMKLKELGVEFIGDNTTNVTHSKNIFTLYNKSKKIIQSEQLLIATGRVPNTNLQLEKANISYNKNGISIKPTTQTTNPDVFAIGDCTADMPKFTHFAYHMGKTVNTNLIIKKYLKLPLYFAKVKPALNPSVVFTSTELAEAGLNESEAKKTYSNIKTYTLNFESLDRAITNQEPGTIKIITTGFLGRIVGVSIFAARAGEILPEFQTMIAEKRTILYFNKLIRAYPTYTANLDNFFKQWLASIISK